MSGAVSAGIAEFVKTADCMFGKIQRAAALASISFEGGFPLGCWCDSGGPVIQRCGQRRREVGERKFVRR